MSNYRQGAIVMLGEKLVKMASQLLIMILMARYLGPSDLGSLMYCYALASIFIFLNNFGLNSLLVKWLAEEPHNSRHLLRHAFSLRFAAAVASVGLANLAGLWLVEDNARVLLLLISLYHLLMPISIIEWYFQARGRADLSAYGLIAGSVVGFIIRLAVLILGVDILWLGAAYSLELVAVATVYAIIWRKEKLAGNAEISKEALIRMAGQALPLLLSGAVIMLYMRIDQLMLGYMVGDEEVGIYSAAVRLSEAWYFVGLTILSVYFPRFLQVRQECGEQAYFSAIVSIGRLLVWGALVLVLVTSLISNWLVGWLYGAEFNRSSDVLVITIWSVVFVYMGTTLAKHYIAIGRTKLLLYRSVLGLLVNSGFNLFLIPAWGAFGAAIGLLVSQFCVGLLFPLFASDKNEMRMVLRIIIPLKW